MVPLRLGRAKLNGIRKTITPQLETERRKDRTTERRRSPAFFVFLFICVWAGDGCRTTLREAVRDTAYWTVEGYRTLDEAMVC